MLKKEWVTKGELTLENLRKLVLPEGADSIYFNNKWEDIKRDIGTIASIYDREIEYVIYCATMLFKFNLVVKDNYYEAYENNKKLLPRFNDEYKRISSKIESYRMNYSKPGYYKDNIFEGCFTNRKECSYLIAKGLYMDEAVALSCSLRLNSVYNHRVRKKNDMYEITIDINNVVERGIEYYLVIALKSFIARIIGRNVTLIEGNENKLVLKEDGRLDKIISIDDNVNYLETSNKLVEYIQNILKN